MVNLEGKPKCEIFCPFAGCDSKLSTVKQLNGSTKFNSYNFERHFLSQHVTRKRKPFDDITNTVGFKINKMNDNTEAVFDSQQDAPSSSHAARLENELRQYKERVDELEAILRQQQQVA